MNEDIKSIVKVFELGLKMLDNGIKHLENTKESTELQLQVAKENRKVQAKQLNQIKTMLKDM